MPQWVWSNVSWLSGYHGGWPSGWPNILGRLTYLAFKSVKDSYEFLHTLTIFFDCGRLFGGNISAIEGIKLIFL